MAAFDSFMNQDKYLNSHRGQYAERNGAKLPYYGSFDFRFLQDIYTSYKNRKGGLQFTVDITNVGNLLSKSWGVGRSIVTTQPLTSYPSSKGNTGYKFNVITENGVEKLPTNTYRTSYTTGSIWSMQLGLRLIF
jgi:hypothetical protein